MARRLTGADHASCSRLPAPRVRQTCATYVAGTGAVARDTLAIDPVDRQRPGWTSRRWRAALDDTVAARGGPVAQLLRRCWRTSAPSARRPTRRARWSSPSAPSRWRWPCCSPRGSWAPTSRWAKASAWRRPPSLGGPGVGLFAARARRRRAQHARPPGRPDGGQRGPAGLRADPLHPRAAHPPREGHLQHLHQPRPDGPALRHPPGPAGQGRLRARWRAAQPGQGRLRPRHAVCELDGFEPRFDGAVLQRVRAARARAGDAEATRARAAGEPGSCAGVALGRFCPSMRDTPAGRTSTRRHQRARIIDAARSRRSQLTAERPRRTE